MSKVNCTFCNIYNGTEPAEILYKDEEIIVFSDIKPAANHHYLVVPKIHIDSIKHLTKEQAPIVENLVKHGKRILHEKGGDLNNLRIGFHRPPFNSISHLHLHVISPATQMSSIQKLIFLEANLWFVNPEFLLQKIKN